MRYIGSKLSLLPQLAAAIGERETRGGVFCDVFSGTGVVGKYFKSRFSIIANDHLYFSYILQYASIVLNEEPDFTELRKKVGDPFKYLNSLEPFQFKFEKEPFVAKEFSPFQGSERQYFRERNALHIDAIRQVIQEWFEERLISEQGYKYLLASLIEVVPSVSNIAGTYGAYLKHWDPRTTKPIFLEPTIILNNEKVNIAYNLNANKLIKEIEGEVLYIDPPYNGRQYLANYHILETIAKYDYPVLRGKTGIRFDLEKTSDYCKKNEVARAFDDLLNNARFDFFFISYSTEGLLELDELISISERYSKPGSLKVYKFPYRRYSRIKDEKKPIVYEIIVSGER